MKNNEKDEISRDFKITLKSREKLWELKKKVLEICYVFAKKCQVLKKYFEISTK